MIYHGARHNSIQGSVMRMDMSGLGVYYASPVETDVTILNQSIAVTQSTKSVSVTQSTKGITIQGGTA